MLYFYPDQAPGSVMSMSWSKYAEFLAFGARPATEHL
jgi:hypothetical protein